MLLDRATPDDDAGFPQRQVAPGIRLPEENLQHPGRRFSGSIILRETQWGRNQGRGAIAMFEFYPSVCALSALVVQTRRPVGLDEWPFGGKAVRTDKPPVGVGPART